MAHIPDHHSRPIKLLEGAVLGLAVRRAIALAEAQLTSDPVPGYALQRWNRPALDELLESYAVVREAINDAPHASDDEWERFDGARVRDLEKAVARRRRQIRVTAALDTAGDVVAFTEHGPTSAWSPGPGLSCGADDYVTPASLLPGGCRSRRSIQVVAFGFRL